MEKKTRFNLIYFFIAFAAILMIENYLFSREIAAISYSEFKVLLKDDLINDLQIRREAIEGKLSAGAYDRIISLRKEKDENKIKQLKEMQSFFVVRMEDPDLVKEFSERGINYTVTLEVTWFRTLLAWVIPIFIFVAIWYFLLKKMGTAGGGLMAVGKSKAKVYVEGETKVTFEDVAGVEEAEEELKEVIEFLKNPRSFKPLEGKYPRGYSLSGRQAPARPCWQRQLQVRLKSHF